MEWEFFVIHFVLNSKRVKFLRGELRRRPRIRIFNLFRENHLTRIHTYIHIIQPKTIHRAYWQRIMKCKISEWSNLFFVFRTSNASEGSSSVPESGKECPDTVTDWWRCFDWLLQSARFLDWTRTDGCVIEVKEERNNSVQSGGTVERDAADAFKLSDIDVANWQQRGERQQPVERDGVLRRGRFRRGGRHGIARRALVEQHEPL